MSKSRALGRMAKVGAGIVLTFAVVAIVGPFFVGDPLATDPSAILAPPSSEHWFGTDRYGRDVFARSVHATRLDLAIGVTISGFAFVLGSAIGVVAGYRGGVADELTMRLTDIVLAFPSFLLALILVAVLGNSVTNVLIAVSISYVPYFVRLTRGEVLSIREEDYVLAARVSGNGPWRVPFLHVLPNALRPAVVYGTLTTGWAIRSVATLAFLGVGIRPPTAEWGVMVADGTRDVVTGDWWTALIPGALIVLVVVAFNFLAEDFGVSSDSG